MKRLFTLIALVLTVVGFSVADSNAAVKTIKPYELKPFDTSVVYYQWPSYVSSGTSTTNAFFYATVKFPAGKNVKKLTYYHRGHTTATTNAYLFRVKMGEDPQIMAFASSTDTTNNIIPVEDYTIEFSKIKSGYTYFIQVTSQNYNSSVMGVKITYK